MSIFLTHIATGNDNNKNGTIIIARIQGSILSVTKMTMKQIDIGKEKFNIVIGKIFKKIKRLVIRKAPITKENEINNFTHQV